MLLNLLCTHMGFLFDSTQVQDVAKHLGIDFDECFKEIGGAFYYHVSSIPSEIKDSDGYLEVLSRAPMKVFDVLKYIPDKQISLIVVNDLKSHEPVVKQTFNYNLVTKTCSHREFRKNPPVYHHFWSFGLSTPIDRELSFIRSLWWKLQLGSSRQISSTIGFRDNWLKFTSSLLGFDDLLTRIDSFVPKQSCTSKKTSINSNKLPKGISALSDLPMGGKIVFDYGCGRFLNSRQFVSDLGGLYLGFDPFNRTSFENQVSLMYWFSGRVDYIVCSNVLNVISEDDLVQDICTKVLDKVVECGAVALFTVYEGNKSGIGRLVRDDQYQRNEPLGCYLARFMRNDVTVSVKSSVIIIKKAP
ncbi:TPA: hypothetical protein I7730_14710 [Vibrio vulnificus]|uniref:Uncharacterized protein n=1 Tax=Vibrio vulnificus TaxID=672 RepID=A0A8H9TFU3_VIBVL|nr:hypothetical protein [Vibrio vulnificus]HAS8541028.1 hypothetical protein [Vibrio vulnificus]